MGRHPPSIGHDHWPSHKTSVYRWLCHSLMSISWARRLRLVNLAELVESVELVKMVTLNRDNI